MGRTRLEALLLEELRHRVRIVLQKLLVEADRLGHLANGAVKAAQVVLVDVRLEEALKGGKIIAKTSKNRQFLAPCNFIHLIN